MEGIDPLADEIGILGGEFCGVEVSDNADESEIALDVVTPFSPRQKPRMLSNRSRRDKCLGVL